MPSQVTLSVMPVMWQFIWAEDRLSMQVHRLPALRQAQQLIEALYLSGVYCKKLSIKKKNDKNSPQ
jgi:hypothetical protein